MTDATDLIAQADALFERISTSNVDPFPVSEVATAAIALRDALADERARVVALEAAHERELFDVARVAIEMQMDATDGQHVNPQRAVDEIVAARAALTGEPQP